MGLDHSVVFFFEDLIDKLNPFIHNSTVAHPEFPLFPFTFLIHITDINCSQFTFSWHEHKTFNFIQVNHLFRSKLSKVLTVDLVVGYERESSGKFREVNKLPFAGVKHKQLLVRKHA